MLVEHYDLEVFSPPCDPGAESYAAIARLAADLAPVLPYLNATLAGAEYQPAAPALSWRHGECYVVFHPHQIAATAFADRGEAIREIEALIDLLNRTWERRAEITPSHAGRRPPPAPVAVYRLLPQTNCKRCGEPTCYVFAAKLCVAQRALADCPALGEPEHAQRRAALAALLGA